MFFRLSICLFLFIIELWYMTTFYWGLLRVFIRDSCSWIDDLIAVDSELSGRVEFSCVFISFVRFLKDSMSRSSRLSLNSISDSSVRFTE